MSWNTEDLRPKEVKKPRNELAVLRAFIEEFNPFYTPAMTTIMTYSDLIEAAKDVAKEL